MTSPAVRSCTAAMPTPAAAPATITAQPPVEEQAARAARANNARMRATLHQDRFGALNAQARKRSSNQRRVHVLARNPRRRRPDRSAWAQTLSASGPPAFARRAQYGFGLAASARRRRNHMLIGL